MINKDKNTNDLMGELAEAAAQFMNGIDPTGDRRAKGTTIGDILMDTILKSTKVGQQASTPQRQNPQESPKPKAPKQGDTGTTAWEKEYVPKQEEPVIPRPTAPSTATYEEHYLFAQILKGLLVEGKNVLVVGETATGKTQLVTALYASLQDNLEGTRGYLHEEINTRGAVTEVNAVNDQRTQIIATIHGKTIGEAIDRIVNLSGNNYKNIFDIVVEMDSETKRIKNVIQLTR